MRWAAVLEGEHLVAAVVVSTEEVALAVLDPGATCLTRLLSPGKSGTSATF
jgi:D-serine deaminase-like pyridoxal phosphate-dependent protein